MVAEALTPRIASEPGYGVAINFFNSRITHRWAVASFTATKIVSSPAILPRTSPQASRARARPTALASPGGVYREGVARGLDPEHVLGDAAPVGIGRGAGRYSRSHQAPIRRGQSTLTGIHSVAKL